MRKVLPVLLLLLGAPAYADETLPVTVTAVVVQRLPQQNDAALHAVAELFAARSEAVSVVKGMTFVEPQPEVMIARTADNGKVVTTCVNSEQAAQQFIESKATPDNAHSKDQ